MSTHPTLSPSGTSASRRPSALRLAAGTGSLLLLGAALAPATQAATVGGTAAAPAAPAATRQPFAPGPHGVAARAAVPVSGSMRPAATPAAAGTVTNAGFETGDLSGFTADQTFAGQSSGGPSHLYAYTGTVSSSGYDIPAPAEGRYAAILDDGSGVGSEVLYQDVTIPAGGGRLSLTYAYQSFAPLADPESFDYTRDPNTAPVQQFRVDVVKTSAGIRSAAAGDILTTLVRTRAGGPTSLGQTPVSADLTPFAGQTVRIRMITADNQDSLLAEVDGITLTATPAAALPEAPIAALLPLGAFALVSGGLAVRRRSHR